MDLASKAVFGIDGVKLSLQVEAKRLSELSQELLDLHLSLNRSNQVSVLKQIEGIKNAISMCHTMLIHYQIVLTSLYEDYNTKPETTSRSTSEDTEVLDFEGLKLAE